MEFMLKPVRPEPLPHRPLSASTTDFSLHGSKNPAGTGGTSNHFKLTGQRQRHSVYIGTPRFWDLAGRCHENTDAELHLELVEEP